MSLATLLQFEHGQPRLDLPPAMARMFEWDSVDHVYAKVISQRHGRLYGDAVFPSSPPAADLGQARYYDGRIDGQPVRIVAIDAPVPQGSDDRVTVTRRSA